MCDLRRIFASAATSYMAGRLSHCLVSLIHESLKRFTQLMSKTDVSFQCFELNVHISIHFSFLIALSLSAAAKQSIYF